MNFFDLLKGLINDPTQILSPMGLNVDAMKNPQAAVQQMLNSGRITQQQLNEAQTAAKNLMNNPMFKRIFG